MKQLLILRHAKSSWKHPGLDDHDRPLNPRGERDAPRMGAWIRQNDIVPDCILSSTALRAHTTAQRVAEACGFEGQQAAVADLYLAAPQEYLEQLALLDDVLNRPMVVGHNPGLEELVFALTGSEQTMPTAALAVVELPVTSWSEMYGRPPRGRLLNLWRPKELSDLPGDS